MCIECWACCSASLSYLERQQLVNLVQALYSETGFKNLMVISVVAADNLIYCTISNRIKNAYL